MGWRTKAIIVCLLFFIMFVIVNITQAETLAIIKRSEWGASPPGVMKKQKPVRLTIHHTAALHNPKKDIKSKMLALQAFSRKESVLAGGFVKPAWPDVPYHYYIDCFGKVAEGRDVHYVGDTNTRYDPAGHIAVVLEGNFEQEKPTRAQIESLVQLLTSLMRQWSIPAENAKGHKEYAATACPGKNMDLEAILRQINLN